MNYLITLLLVSMVSVSFISSAQALFLKVDATSVEEFSTKAPIRVWKATQFQSLTADTQRIVLQLPDGIVAALYKKNARTEDSRLHWQGRVEGDPFGQATLVQNESQISGEVSVGGRRFVISQMGNDTNKQLAVSETTQMDYEGAYKNAPAPDFSALTAVATPSTDNFIDVMVIYTDDVAVNADAEDVLRARVDSVNEILATSCANFRYRLVYIGTVSYAETGAFATDLTALTSTSDGIMDSIHTLRDTYGADLVQLITDTGDACGLGYLGQDGFYDEDYGFSVSLYWCNARTMAHEWGHNLSISHDRYEEDVAIDESTVLLNGYGYVDLANKYRDTMSYATHCTDLGVTCTALDMFSNARIKHNGIPFGIEGYADSVSRMNDSFSYIANYRTAVNAYTADIDNNCVGSSDNKDLHCFVASTVYKSYHHENVQKLRSFRNQWLSGNKLGRGLIQIYYKYSPYVAKKMSEHSWLSAVVALFLSGIIFLAENSFFILLMPIFMLISFLTLRRRTVQIGVVFLAGIVLSQNTRAQIATPSHFIYLSGQNPSVRLLREAKPYAAIQYFDEKQNIEATAYSEEHDDQNLNLMLAFISTEYFFEIQFTPTHKYEHTIKQTGFTDSVTEYSEQDYLVQAGTHFFTIPFGFKYQSEKVENLSLQQKTKNRAVGVGTTLELASYVNFGAGVDLREQSGDGLAKAQWLQPYMGLALGQMPQKSNMASGGNEFFVEAGFSRAPEVQNTEGATVTSLGQMTETIISGEVTLNTGLASVNQLFARLSSKKKKEKATNYILEDAETSTMSTHFGFTLPYASGDKLFIGALFERTERVGTLTNETQYMGFTISYSGQAGGSSAPALRSVK